MNCGVKDYNSMSEDKAGESKTVNFEEKDQEDSTLVPLLSDYSKKLESRVKRRYIEKKSVIGVTTDRRQFILFYLFYFSPFFFVFICISAFWFALPVT